jgi:hypothetical protein
MGTSKYSFFKRTRARSRRCEAPRGKHSPMCYVDEGQRRRCDLAAGCSGKGIFRGALMNIRKSQEKDIPS